MTMVQLIYSSQPFGYDDLSLSGILASARQNNRRDNITGALICREDLYLQMLEGEPDVIKDLFARIIRDDRHTSVVKLVSTDIEARLFPGWAMRHDPARSWMWTPEEVAAGVLSRVAPEDIRRIFTRLASEPPAVAQTCPMHDA
jgi:Sensors of blue-light using FAD